MSVKKVKNTLRAEKELKQIAIAKNNERYFKITELKQGDFLFFKYENISYSVLVVSSVKQYKPIAFYYFSKETFGEFEFDISYLYEIRNWFRDLVEEFSYRLSFIAPEDLRVTLHRGDEEILTFV